MTHPLSLLCILAHLDDACMGTDPILAKYAADGVQTSLVVATWGERDWHGNLESANHYRADSLVNSGRQVEDDLFAGLRE